MKNMLVCKLRSAWTVFTIISGAQKPWLELILGTFGEQQLNPMESRNDFSAYMHSLNPTYYHKCVCVAHRKTVQYDIRTQAQTSLALFSHPVACKHTDFSVI